MFELAQIETSTACNAKCKMCPRSEATRSTHSERMPTELFWRVVEQVYDLGIRHVLPFIDGEPLADPRMVDFVEQLAKRYPDVVIGWYTNGSLLTPPIAARLLSAGNIKGFNVSMQGGDKETYEATMGLSWERTLANVEQLIALNETLGRPVELRANMCVFGPTQASVEAFKARWGGRMTLCLGAYANFGGLGHDAVGELPWRGQQRHVCDRATKHVYVYWNGDVGQCCFDLTGSVTYGNLVHERLSDVVASPKYQAMRTAHLELDEAKLPPVCIECNACKFHG